MTSTPSTMTSYPVTAFNGVSTVATTLISGVYTRSVKPTTPEGKSSPILHLDMGFN